MAPSVLLVAEGRVLFAEGFSPCAPAGRAAFTLRAARFIKRSIRFVEGIGESDKYSVQLIAVSRAQ